MEGQRGRSSRVASWCRGLLLGGLLGCWLAQGGSAAGRGEGIGRPTQPSPSSALIQAAIQKGDQGTLIRLLQAQRRGDPQRHATQNYDYLLGRLLSERGDGAEARRALREVVVRQSILAADALWSLVEIARRTGRETEEEELLRRLLAGYPTSRFRQTAVDRLATLLAQKGDHAGTIDLLQRWGAGRRESLLRIAKAHLAAGDESRGSGLLTSLYTAGISDQVALQAILALDAQGAKGAHPPLLSETDRRSRARLYQTYRYFREARRHWEQLLRDFPRSASRLEALSEMAKGYYQEEAYAAAIPWYTRVAEMVPDQPEGEEAFYQVGHCYQGLGDVARAIARYEAFLATYPRSRYRGYAYLNAVDTLRSAGRVEEALEWAVRLGRDLADPFFQVASLWSTVCIQLSQERYDAALAGLLTLRQAPLSTQGLRATTTLAEIDYLRGDTLEKLGRFREAMEVYLALPERRDGAGGYYGRRATVRLHRLSRNARARRLVELRRGELVAETFAASRRGDFSEVRRRATQALRFPHPPEVAQQLDQLLRESYRQLPAYQLPPFPLGTIAPASLAGQLLALGLEEEAAAELVNTNASPATIAYYCAVSPCVDRTLRYSEPILGRLPPDYRPELLPTPWARIFYPKPYRRLFGQLEREWSASAPASRPLPDPLLILSLARQESRFQPRAVSAAAALGILQFIAPTALSVAGQLALPAFELGQLFDPELSFRLGFEHVSRLQEEFGSSAMVAAAYNGSEASVRRWIARAGNGDPARQVSEILKKETKEYVFHVENYLAAYRQLLLSPDRATRSD
jgi:soluble lytic murein transglycosylase-like protein/TolA-binding protein